MSHHHALHHPISVNYFIIYKDLLGNRAVTKISGRSIWTSLIKLVDSNDIPDMVLPQNCLCEKKFLACVDFNLRHHHCHLYLDAIKMRFDVAVLCQVENMHVLHHCRGTVEGKVSQPRYHLVIDFIPSGFLCFPVTMDSLRQNNGRQNK